MSNKSAKGNKQVGAEEKIETALGKTEDFFQKNGKSLVTFLIVVTLLVGGYFAYQNLYYNPRAEKAAESMFVAEQLFAEDDFEVALNGDGNNPGFIEVVDNYGGTKPGRLAAHYAGICYLKLGDLDNALEYLKKYKSASGATAAIINAQNLGLQGDIYSAKGDANKAAELYKKAANSGDNVLTTPYFLKKLAGAYIQLGNNKGAIEAYNRIKNDFAQSVEARDIDKFIGIIE